MKRSGDTLFDTSWCVEKQCACTFLSFWTVSHYHPNDFENEQIHCQNFVKFVVFQKDFVAWFHFCGVLMCLFLGLLCLFFDFKLSYLEKKIFNYHPSLDSWMFSFSVSFTSCVV